MEIPLRGCLHDANPFGVFLQADCAVIGLDLRAGLERGWQDGRGFFFGRGSLFFPCPPGGGLGGEPQARSSSFAFFFSVFASLAEAPPLQAPEGGGVQLRQGAFFPLRFSFFFRSPGRTGRALSSP